MAGDAKFANVSAGTIGGGYSIPPEDLKKIILPPNLSRWKVAEGDDLEDLCRSLADPETGQLQPAVIRKDAQQNAVLVAGYRRLAAIKRINADLATYGLDQPMPLLVRLERVGEKAALRLNIAENRFRSSLSPVDEACAARSLERLGWSRPEIAETLGHGESRVGQLLSLFDLPEDVLDLVHERKMPDSLARKLLGLSPSKIKRAVERIQAGDKAAAVKAEVVADRRESGKRTGRTIAELREELAPLVEDGVPRAVQFAEWLSGEPKAAGLAVILGPDK